MPSNFTRRTVLRTSGIALGAALAGCFGLGNQSQPSSDNGDVDGGNNPSGGGSNGGGSNGGGSNSGGFGGGSSGGKSPTGSRDRYGLQVRNKLTKKADISLSVIPPGSAESPLDKIVTVGPGKVRTWDDLMTKQGEYAVVAKLPDREDRKGIRTSERGVAHTMTYTKWVDVGTDDVPAVPNVVVTLFSIDAKFLVKSDGAWTNVTRTVPKPIIHWQGEDPGFR